MAKPLWATWDNFGAPDASYARIQVQRPTHFNEFRCRDRVRDVSAMAAKAPDAPSAGALASDLKRRQSCWLEEIDSGRAEFKPVTIRPKSVRNFLLIACIALTLIVAAFAVTRSDRYPWLIALFMLLPVTSFAFWPLVQEMRRTAKVFAARFRVRQCPDCGHDLSTITPAIDPDTLHSVWVGPAECPGCSVPWPMVPPPMPAKPPEPLA